MASSTSKSTGSWSLEQGLAKSEVVAKAPGVSLGHKGVVALRVPLEHGDSEMEEFPPEGFQPDLREVDLEQKQHKYQVPLEFELEVPLETDQACNPFLDRIALYKECFWAGLRLLLFPFS